VKHQPDPAWVDVGGDHPVKRGFVFTVRQQDDQKKIGDTPT
jgi:hypothetical protein